KVLHVAGGFAQHALYPQLVRSLAEYCEHQTVFAAVRSTKELLSQPANEAESLRFLYRHILEPHHRLFFRTKVRVVRNEIQRLVDPANFDVVHAHTLYSDGV